MGAVRMCKKCGLKAAKPDSATCTSCDEEAAFLAGGASPLELRRCAVCKARMKLDPRDSGPFLYCPNPKCGATFDLSTSRLSAPEADPTRIEGRTRAGANMVVRNDGKKRLDAERRKVLEAAEACGSAPKEASPPELLILVLESEVPGVKKQAFNRLFNAGCEAELRAIADSDSIYARTARAELARTKEPWNW